MEKTKYSRDIIGKGMEHIVLQPKRRQLKDHSLVKIPRLLQRLSFWPYDPVQTLKYELIEAESLVAGTSVKIPHICIHPEKSYWPGSPIPGYIMRQQTVRADQSVNSIRDHLVKTGLDTLVDEFDHEPRNFIAENGVVYWVDPTKATAARFLEKIGIKPSDWRKAKVIAHKPIRLLGL